MKSKRILSLLLSLILVLSLLPSLPVFAETQNGTCGSNLTWTFSDGVLTISGTGEMTVYSSRENVPWYEFRNSISSVVINEGVTLITTEAFWGSESMTSVVFPESLTEIGMDAFAFCTALASVTIPSSVKKIAANAFADCSALNSLTISSGVETIGNYAFCKTGLTSVTIPSGVTTINQGAFSGCEHLTSITIPVSVTFLGASVCGRPTSLTDVYYWGSETQWNSITFGEYNDIIRELATIHYNYRPAPAITSHPSNKTVAAGEKATFKVVASGDDLTYQWQYSKNGTTWTDKAGATSASYAVTAKASYNGLYYRCKVSNAGGEVFSNKARLTVTSTAKPVITTQPANKTVAAGASATFQVAASGTGLTYQWQYKTAGSTTWKNKTGATSATYTVTAKASYNGMLYRCRVKNSGGTVYSSKVRLTVSGVKPKILSQPKAATAAAGGSVTFKVIAAGESMSYQWQYSTDGGTTWKNKTGATSASYTVTARASYNGILYRCRVKNSYGTVYSESAKLTVS